MTWPLLALLGILSGWLAVGFLVEALAWRAIRLGRRRAPPCFGAPPRRGAESPAAAIVFLGDVQRGVADVALPLARVLRESPADLLVSSGDLAAHAEAPYFGVLFDAFEAAGIGTPTRVVPGNHDLLPRGGDDPAPGRRLFRDRFGSPDWAIRVGPVLVVGVDDALEGVGAERLAEVRRRVGEHAPGPWIAVCHRPPRRVDEEDARVERGLEDFVGLLEERPPLLMVAGHAHTFSDRTVRGVRYVVNAHGGDVHGLALRRGAFELVCVDVGPGGDVRVLRTEHRRRRSARAYANQLAVRCWWSRRRGLGRLLALPAGAALRLLRARAPA